MYLLTEVLFYSSQRKHLPASGYRPDATFHTETDYWGITFLDLPVTSFDTPTPASIQFSFQEIHYDQVEPGQEFRIMEGSRQVGEGRILSIED